MNKIAAILFCLTYLVTASIGEINRSVQSGVIIKRESTGESKKYDNQYKGAKYTFIDLHKDEVTVLIEKPAPYNSKSSSVYIKTMENGTDIILKKKSATLTTQDIHINTKLMEFVYLDAGYIFDEEFVCSISYGKLKR